MALLAIAVEKPRQIAARILGQYSEGADYLENLLEKQLSTASLKPADRALVQELTFGVVRWQATLDWLIRQKTGGRTQKTMLQILLRLGLYQIFWLERIPDHAAVHETVELAKELAHSTGQDAVATEAVSTPEIVPTGKTPSVKPTARPARQAPSPAGFINAILRGYLREKAETEAKLAQLKMRDPALGYSHPDWLVEHWQKRWGKEKIARLLEWNNTPPPTYARLNTLKTHAAKLTEQWQAEGVQFLAREWNWTGKDLVFELQSHPRLSDLPSFQQGLFYIQDPSTLLAAQLLNPQPGEKVLDLCAAPGGKTTFIAQQMQNDGHIDAQDISQARLDLVRQNCARLGISCVQASLLSDTPAQITQSFDAVLVDAPCSNTGVMRRRVDLRWRIRPEEIQRLRRSQLDLLGKAALHLKKSGRLIYSTCSLEPEENEQVIREFLAAQPDFRLAEERTLLPFLEGVDGAYVAKVVRGS